MAHRCIFALLLGLTLLLSACPAPSQEPTPEGGQLLRLNATVTRVELEGGFFGLITDSGERYDPGQLPPEFRTDGLPVRVVLRRVTPGVTTRMWGQRVELVRIERR